MGAKLNFNTHLLNIMFDFLSYLSAGPTCSTVQKLWYSIYYYPFMARSVYCVTLSLTPGGQNLCQIVKKDTFCSAEQFAQAVLFIYYIIIILYYYFTLINPFWEAVSGTVR